MQAGQWELPFGEYVNWKALVRYLLSRGTRKLWLRRSPQFESHRQHGFFKLVIEVKFEYVYWHLTYDRHQFEEGIMKLFYITKQKWWLSAKSLLNEKLTGGGTMSDFKIDACHSHRHTRKRLDRSFRKKEIFLPFFFKKKSKFTCIS